MAVGAGASGAIFGMAGVLFAFVRLKKTPAHPQISKNMVGSIGSFIVYNLVIGAAIPGISNAAGNTKVMTPRCCIVTGRFARSGRE